MLLPDMHIHPVKTIFGKGVCTFFFLRLGESLNWKDQLEKVGLELCFIIVENVNKIIRYFG